MSARPLNRFFAGVAALGAMLAATAAHAAMDEAAVKALYEKAKAEGEVIVWGPTSAELEWIGPALAKNYPGIEVKWNADLRSGPKIVAEARAGKTSLDVFVFSMGGAAAIQQRGLFAEGPFKEFGLDEDGIYYGGTQGATHNLLYVVGYNTEKVSAEELPKSWAGFTDPKWKGKLVASPFLLPRLSGFLAMAWGEEKTANWLRTLINDQDLMVTNAPREGILKSGERVVTITDFTGTIETYEKNGVPMKWVPMDVVGTVQFTASVLKGAPHPNAARFLAGWLTTPEAAEARGAHNGNFSVRRESDDNRIAQVVRKFKSKTIIEAPDNMDVRRKAYGALSPIVTGQKK